MGRQHPPLLWGMVRLVSLRGSLDRPERFVGRHGVSPARTDRKLRLSLPPLLRDGGGARDRPPVVLRHAGQQRGRRGLARRRGEQLQRDQVFRKEVRAARQHDAAPGLGVGVLRRRRDEFELRVDGVFRRGGAGTQRVDGRRGRKIRLRCPLLLQAGAVHADAPESGGRRTVRFLHARILQKVHVPPSWNGGLPGRAGGDHRKILAGGVRCLAADHGIGRSAGRVRLLAG